MVDALIILIREPAFNDVTLVVTEAVRWVIEPHDGAALLKTLLARAC